MTIIRMWAGLGNQMFIYAYYRALQEQGIDAKLDLTWYKQFGSAQHGYGYLIPDLFPKSKNVYATEAESRKLAVFGMDPVSRALRKIGVNKGTYLSQTKRYNSFAFSKDLLDKSLVDEKFIEGYFQSEKYFKPIEHIIRKEFAMNIDEKSITAYLTKINQNNSVSMHIRRGDYVSNSNGNLLLCNSHYYENAINYIKSMIKNPEFFIFSDDIDWCKDKFSSFADTKFEHVQNTPAPQYDMYLMSQCKHNIIANSSFSWWGAWLNSNPDKIVICPSTWTDTEEFNSDGICPDEWVRVERCGV